MKLFSGLLSFVFVLTILYSPVFAQTNDQFGEASDSGRVDVYALFWPIVPGTTVADPMFILKQLKETVGGVFTFGTVAKSEYQIGLSEKRLVEANKLVEDKDYANALKSINLNESARAAALDLKKKAIEEKAETLELTNKLVKSIQNQEKALAYLSAQIPDDQEGDLQEILRELPLQISEAK